MTTHVIYLIGGEDDETAEITEVVVGDECVLTCLCRGKTIRAAAGNFFDALCRIRLELEKERLLLFCYGASVNAMPSGQTKYLSARIGAYRLRNEVPPTWRDLVDIFADGPDVIPATVGMQREFRERFFASTPA